MSPSRLPYISVRLDAGLKAAFEAAARKRRLAVAAWLLQAGIEQMVREGRILPERPSEDDNSADYAPESEKPRRR